MSRDTTLVMLTWNALDHVRLTVSSLLASEEDFWLIILDNGSRAPTVNYLSAVAETNNNVKLLRNHRNEGVWRGRIKAAKYVETRFLGTIDSDLCFPTSWLAPLESVLTDENVGQVGPLKLSANLRHPYVDQTLKDLWTFCKAKCTDPLEQLQYFTCSTDFDTFAEDVALRNSEIREEIDIPTRSISGCVMLTRTDLYRDPRLNDATYGQENYGFEDLDYSWSLSYHGYRVLKSKGVYVHHFEHSSMEGNSVSIRKQSQANTLYFARKWESQLTDWARSKLGAGESAKAIRQNELIRILLCYPRTQLPNKLRELLCEPPVG